MEECRESEKEVKRKAENEREGDEDRDTVF